MTSIYLQLQAACNRSSDLSFVGSIFREGNRWMLSNRTGLVVGKGDTPIDACKDALNPCEVIR